MGRWHGVRFRSALISSKSQTVGFGSHRRAARNTGHGLQLLEAVRD